MLVPFRPFEKGLFAQSLPHFAFEAEIMLYKKASVRRALKFVLRNKSLDKNSRSRQVGNSVSA